MSFDNVAVGQLMGDGLQKCLTADGKTTANIVYINGAASDNNAALFKQGYDSVLQPKYDSKDYTKGPDDSVPDWNNTTGGTIFEQQLTKTSNKIDGVLAANDGLALEIGLASRWMLHGSSLGGGVPAGRPGAARRIACSARSRSAMHRPRDPPGDVLGRGTTRRRGGIRRGSAVSS